MNSHSLCRISGFVPSTAVLSGVIGLALMSGCGGEVVDLQDPAIGQAVSSVSSCPSRAVGPLMNIDFYGDGSVVGPAAFGMSSQDYWNATQYASTWGFPWTAVPLNWSNQVVSSASYTLPGWVGSWFTNGFGHPFDSNGFKPANGGGVSITGLAANTYRFFLYGEGGFSIQVKNSSGAVAYLSATKLTNQVAPVPGQRWTENAQYVVLDNVRVTTGATVNVITTCTAATCPSVGVTGLQLVATASQDCTASNPEP